MGEFSLTHIIVIALIFLIFFGPSRLPGLGKSIGQAIKGFKQGINEIEADAKPVDDHPEQIQNQNNQNQNAQNQKQKDKQNS